MQSAATVRAAVSNGVASAACGRDLNPSMLCGMSENTIFSVFASMFTAACYRVKACFGIVIIAVAETANARRLVAYICIKQPEGDIYALYLVDMVFVLECLRQQPLFAAARQRYCRTLCGHRKNSRPRLEVI